MNAAVAGAGSAAASDQPEERRPITMPVIIALVLIAVVALAVLGFAVHILFSPWLLLVAIAVLAWMRFRPGRSHR